MNGWSAERKKKASIQIHRWKPWLSSLGPRSAEGKAKVSKNALKHGARSAETLRVRRVLSGH